MVQNENSKDGKILESPKTIESKISKNHEKLTDITANNITNNSVEIAKQGLICKYYYSIYSCWSKIRKKVQINKG